MTLARRLLPPIWFLTAWSIAAIGSIDVTAQATYVPVGGGPGTIAEPQAFFSVSSPDVCSDKRQTLPHKGFVKAGTDVTIDALASNTGHCDVYISKKYYSTQWRDINYILWSHTHAGGTTVNLQYHGGNPRPDVDPQVYDTRTPGGGNSGVDRSTNNTGDSKCGYRGIPSE